MDEERAKRYEEKLNFVSERMEDIESWLPERTEEFLLDKKTRLAVYKAFQEAVETCLDVVAMLCKDEKIMPKDDYQNLEELYQRGLMNPGLKGALARANGLRNILVHRYNLVEDRLAFESIRELLPSLSQFVDWVEKWLKRNL
jgi:uncharacterized protein YutE (UPF0331/DUF86 family)